MVPHLFFAGTVPRYASRGNASNGAAALIAVLHHVWCHDGMQRITISISEELLHRLRMLAAERGTSMATLAREALEEKIKDYRPRPRSWGIGASGYADTASEAGDLRPAPRSWR